MNAYLPHVPAAGLATRGIRPVVAIYSTFLQRAYDNIIHDVAIQALPVTFCMDRAGLVGEDGETHMGLYDIAYMLAVPGMTVTAPKDSAEMLALLRAAIADKGGPFCLRYPRDTSELGATTNAQGMIVRAAGGRFLHVEMDEGLRRDLACDAALRGRAFEALARVLEDR